MNLPPPLQPAQKQLLLGIHHKLIVDLFAGGGGMSVAFEMAWGRSPDIAINHSADALSMHQANHPQTRHFIADVFEVCPREATNGQPVGWLHLSPDCTHHSQAAGGQPRSKRIRGLAWVGYRWAGQARPDVISLENVKQILQWGPLVAKRDPATGRVIKLDKSIAAPGERVPIQQQYLVPNPKLAGRTWRHFVRSLEAMGYVVEWRIICAADHGGHTTRERLFMIARRDGQAIRWPEPSHFKKPGRGQQRWKPAADCIDFTRPCRSIFGREKPLAEATLRRIAHGVVKFVLDSVAPFIVGMGGPGYSGKPVGVSMPFGTILTENHRAIVAPVIIQAGHGDGKPGARRWSYGAKDVADPVGTVTASGGGQALASAFLMQANGGFNSTPGHSLDSPVSTITNTGSQQQLVAAFLAQLRRNCDARPLDEPLRTVSAEGMHHGVVECCLSPSDEAGALRTVAFLMRYYGEGGQWSGLRDPMPTVTTRDRLALVTVTIKGTPYVVVDIGLRMLEPRELFRAQDFPEGYIIDHGHDGRKFSKAAQVRMCGNSVNPLMAVGFLRQNAPWMAVKAAA